MNRQTVRCADAVGRNRSLTVLNQGHLTVVGFPAGESASIAVGEARRLQAVLLVAASSVVGVRTS